MIDYNQNAWFELMRLTGLSVEELLQEINSIGITSCTSNFARWRPNGTIPPLDLVSICNHFRFPISFFVRIPGLELQDRNCRIVPPEEWTDIEICTRNLIDYMVEVNRMSRKDAIKKIGCKQTRYDAFRKYPSEPFPPKLTFVTMLSFINNARIYPGDVIIDHNELFPMEMDIRPYYDHEALEAHSRMFPQTRTAMAAENNVVNVKDFLFKYFTQGKIEGDDRIMSISLHDLNELAGTIAKLRSEVDGLRRRNEELEARKQHA